MSTKTLTTLLLLFAILFFVQSESLQELRNRIKESSTVDEYGFKVEKFEVSEIVGNAFEVVGYVQPENKKTTINFSEKMGEVKRDLKRMVSDEILGQ